MCNWRHLNIFWIKLLNRIEKKKCFIIFFLLFHAFFQQIILWVRTHSKLYSESNESEFKQYDKKCLLAGAINEPYNSVQWNKPTLKLQKYWANNQLNRNELFARKKKNVLLP